jgi:phage replication-related protein YjqB (UPF0714/DUF867 family)
MPRRAGLNDECPDASYYQNFADLAKHQARGKDYQIVALARDHSRVALIAPHGGRIETRTSQIARAIAREEFNLYLFEGIRPSSNYRCLHLTSDRFDEPECLTLIARCQTVVAIHGCEGDEKKALLGGLNTSLRDAIAAALRKAGVPAETDGHPFPGTEPLNVCNRGASGTGVQIELTAAIRGSAREARVVKTVRSMLRQVEEAGCQAMNQHIG